MPIKARVENLDDVAEPLRELYRQEGEGFVLDVEEADGLALANVAEHLTARTGLEGKLTEAQQSLAAKDAELQRTRIEAAADCAMRDHGGMVKLLKPHVLAQLGMVNGRVCVVDGEGKPRVSQIPGNGGPMDADELVKAMKEDRDYASVFYARSNYGYGGSGRAG
ncbi:MAG: hypothetical protein KDB90_14475 [Planctomycetes bacterium]|nr:hypothetical protein [Planctomycetota bacterium]